jgi:16S rRNA (cytidine1402-2'-O)-methyltransferase
MTGTLYIIPTPIGNLEDITRRAFRILNEVDYVACEDTRHTGLLIQKLQIPKKHLISYHDYNETQKSNYIISLLHDGKSIALVSDAGTPGISDPGYRIVNSAINEGIEIVSLPGPTAMIPALVASGLPVHNFLFLGFPPAKKGRNTFLRYIETCEHTSVLYESSHKIEKLLGELKTIIGERQICVAKEISKIHEAYFRGTPIECLEQLTQKKAIHGEFVIIIEGLKQRKD